MKKKQTHDIVAIALAYARCECGWQWKKQTSMKGLTDEELALETGLEFTRHKNSMEK